MIQLEGLEVWGGRGISEILAGDLLARVVSDFKTKGSPERHMWTDQLEDCTQLGHAQCHSLHMLLARHSLHHDVQPPTWAPSAPFQICCSSRQMRLLSEAQCRPEPRCLQCNVAPVMADVRHRQLEDRRRHGIVLLVRPQQERRLFVDFCTEHKHSSQQFDWQGMHPFGAAAKHGRRAVKSGEYLIVRRSRKCLFIGCTLHLASNNCTTCYQLPILQTLTVLLKNLSASLTSIGIILT